MNIQIKTYTIFILVGTLTGILVLGLAISIADNHSRYRKNEELTGKKVFFTLSITSKENPSYDFSTEYLDISDLFKQ